MYPNDRIGFLTIVTNVYLDFVCFRCGETNRWHKNYLGVAFINFPTFYLTWLGFPSNQGNNSYFGLHNDSFLYFITIPHWNVNLCWKGYSCVLNTSLTVLGDMPYYFIKDQVGIQNTPTLYWCDNDIIFAFEVTREG